MSTAIKVKKALITRFGGLGDCAPMEVVARQLKKRGYEVTFAVRYDGPHMRLADTFYKNPSFDKVIDFRQMGPWASRCVKTELGWIDIKAIYPDYDLVIDYMNIIESNSTSPYTSDSLTNIWERSRSSNWTNWYDLHLAWANIDPMSVHDEEKRPQYTLTTEEIEQFTKIRANYSKVFVLQTSASSLSRTWFQGSKLADKLLKEHPYSLVLFWNEQDKVWLAMDKDGTKAVNIPGISPLRLSMCLVYISDLFIGADTGFTHIAEGLNKKHIAIYSTVPAWTRNKYYKYQITIDPGIANHEFYTFNLGLGDPLRAIEGDSSLSDRERMVLDLVAKKVPVRAAAEALNASEQGAEMELQALMAKRASFEHQQSKALSSVTVDMVMDKVKEALGG